jgi:hypothetical protein
VDDPHRVSRAGSELLRPLLEGYGYEIGPEETARGSGGPAAVVRWVADDRWIETHVRTGLGIVRYGFGDEYIEHRDFLRWAGAAGAYPGYGDDPVQGFVRLLADLEGPVRPLLLVTRVEFERIRNRIASSPPKRGLP